MKDIKNIKRNIQSVNCALWGVEGSTGRYSLYSPFTEDSRKLHTRKEYLWLYETARFLALKNILALLDLET